MTTLGATHHERIDHKFHFDSLSYDAGVHYQRKFFIRRYARCQISNSIALSPAACVKVSVFFKKLPNVSDEHFFKHWATVHADLTVASKGFNVYKIERYTQVGGKSDATILISINTVRQHHQTQADKKAVQNMGFKTLDYDGCSTLWCRSYEDFDKLMKSTHDGPLGNDSAIFLDSSTITIFAG